MLFLFPLLVIIVLAAGGCTSESTPTPEPLPTEDVIEANDSIVLCQISRFLTWDGSYPRELMVLILESKDVGGLVNHTKDKIDQTIDVIVDKDHDRFYKKLKKTPELFEYAYPMNMKGNPPKRQPPLAIIAVRGTDSSTVPRETYRKPARTTSAATSDASVTAPIRSPVTPPNLFWK